MHIELLVVKQVYFYEKWEARNGGYNNPHEAGSLGGNTLRLHRCSKHTRSSLNMWGCSSNPTPSGPGLRQGRGPRGRWLRQRARGGGKGRGRGRRRRERGEAGMKPRPQDRGGRWRSHTVEGGGLTRWMVGSLTQWGVGVSHSGGWGVSLSGGWGVSYNYSDIYNYSYAHGQFIVSLPNAY